MAELVHWITDFGGVKETLNPSFSKSESRFTRNLSNVSVRYGRISGRQGINELEDITSAASSDINGLGVLVDRANSANILYRMRALAIDELDPSGNTWTDRTGTALTGADTDRPQFVMHKGVLCFTNEGADRPRRITGTGVNSAVLGGTPPFCRSMSALFNYLLLGNVSDDGTFTDLGNGPRIVRYSDDYNVSWDLCDGNELVFNEIEGEILAMAPIREEYFMAYGSTGLARAQFVGGAIRFSHVKVPFGNGILAPLSLAAIDTETHIFLATDRELYVTNGWKVVALPPALIDTLQNTMDVANARQCVAFINHDEETYNLLFPTAASDTWLRGRLVYNYRSKEFYIYTYDGHEFSRAIFMQYDDAQANFIAAAGATTGDPRLVFQLDTGTDDNSVQVNRNWDTDWQAFSTLGDKYLTAITVVGDRNAQTRVSIAIAHNYQTIFRFRRTFALRGRRPADTDARVTYRLPYPILGNVFNARLRLFNDESTNQASIRAVGFHYITLNKSAQEPASNVTAGESAGRV